VFHMILGKKLGLFSKQHKKTGFCIRHGVFCKVEIGFFKYYLNFMFQKIFDVIVTARSMSIKVEVICDIHKAMNLFLVEIWDQVPLCWKGRSASLS
jgi:hypothetical protein